jgi:hypothetical protein
MHLPPRQVRAGVAWILWASVILPVLIVVVLLGVLAIVIIIVFIVVFIVVIIVFIVLAFSTAPVRRPIAIPLTIAETISPMLTIVVPIAAMRSVPLTIAILLAVAALEADAGIGEDLADLAVFGVDAVGEQEHGDGLFAPALSVQVPCDAHQALSRRPVETSHRLLPGSEDLLDLPSGLSVDPAGSLLPVPLPPLLAIGAPVLSPVLPVVTSLRPVAFAVAAPFAPLLGAPVGPAFVTFISPSLAVAAPLIAIGFAFGAAPFPAFLPGRPPAFAVPVGAGDADEGTLYQRQQQHKPTQPGQ